MASNKDPEFKIPNQQLSDVMDLLDDLRDRSEDIGKQVSKDVRGISEAVIDGLTNAKKLYMAMGEATQRIGKMTTMLETFHLGSMRAASALDELQRSKKKFGDDTFPLAAEELEEVNRQMKKFKDFTNQVAKDTQLRRDLTKTLTTDIETQTGELLKAKTALASIDANMLGDANMKGFRKQSLDELRKEVGTTTELVDQGEYRLNLANKFLKLNEENAVKEEQSLKKLQSLQKQLTKAKKDAGSGPHDDETKADLKSLVDKIQKEKDAIKGYKEEVKDVQKAWKSESPNKNLLNLDTIATEIRNLENEVGTMTNKRLQVQTAMLEKQITENKHGAVRNKFMGGYMNHMRDQSALGKPILGNLNNQVTAIKGLVESAKLIPPIFFLFDKLLELGYNRFEELDKAAEKFRRSTGFTVDQMAHVRKYAERTNQQFADMGISIEKAYDSAKALTDQFQLASLVTEEAVKNVALMSANLNVAEGDSAQVLSTFQGLGGASEQLAFNVMKVGAGMSRKIGVPFSLVMKDIANASETTISMLSANPTMLMRSAIAARALGTDLNKLTQSQRKLLDFSSSITDELELSALLGTSISFQKSRQLAYEGRIEDAARATLETVKAAGDFDKMSLYQREALAKAAGMELKDLSKMMAVDKKRSEIMEGNDQAAKDRLLAQEATLKKLNEENDLSKQSLADSNEAEIRQQRMQGVITKFKNMWESIVITLGDVLEPIIRDIAETLVPIAKSILPYIVGAAKVLSASFQIVYNLVEGLVTPFVDIVKELFGAVDLGSDFGGYMKEVGVALDTYVLPGFKWVGKVIGTIGALVFRFMIAPFKALGEMIGTTLGLVTEFMSGNIGIGDLILGGLSVVGKFIYNLLLEPIVATVKNIGKLFGDLPKGLVEGLKTVGGACLDVLTWPFVTAWNWIKGIFVGKSPSEIGLGIVQGIKSVGSMLLDVLTWPFRTGLKIIGGIFSGLFDIVKSVVSNVGPIILDGLSSAGGLILDIITWPFKMWYKVISTVAGGILDVITSPFKIGFEFISDVFSGIVDVVKDISSKIGPVLLDGVSLIGGMLYDTIVAPFKTGFEYITSSFSYVIDGIKTAASSIFEFITSPFKQAMELVKSIPLIGKMFGGNDISTSVRPQNENTQVQPNSVVGMENLNALRTAIDGLTSAVLGLSKEDGEESVNNVNMVDTTGIENKLDNLTNLLVGGSICVYLDGSKISSKMSGLA